MRTYLIWALLAMALAGCTFPTAEIWVTVTGSGDWEPPEELVLEIGDTSWDGSGGVASVATASNLDVRLIGRESCQSYVGFRAELGTSWVIRFIEDGSVQVEDWTGRGVEPGPALGAVEPSGCP
jgi:hypothetical protein